MTQSADRPRKRIGFWALLQSILGAGLGVQSSRRHAEDFESGSVAPYIIGGIIFSAAFVGILALIVKIVVP